MNPLLNLALCLTGIIAMIFAGMPVFIGKYVVTETSLEAIRKPDVPQDIVDKIRAGLGGTSFYTRSPLTRNYVRF